MRRRFRGVLASTGLLLICLACSKNDLGLQLSPTDTEDARGPHFCTELIANDHARAFGSRSHFWNKNVLRVRFLGGSEYVRSKVRQYAQEWSHHADMTFVFVDVEPSDIRISFDAESGSWSYVGRTNSYLSPQRATMNFGWFNARTSETEFRRTTLHEFGHALGLQHEHQHPEVAINWDRPAVYSYYARTQDWSRSDVDANIFRRYNSNSTNYSAYDPASIMHYYIPSSLVIGSWTPRWNTRLSTTDKQFIGAIYPAQDDGEIVVDCACPDTLDIIACDDFESYDQSSFEQASAWARWSADAGSGELQTYSWGKVLKMQYVPSANPDILYQPGLLDQGAYSLVWRMYVGANNSAYFNVQKWDVAGREFGPQFYFHTDLTGVMRVNGRQAGFSYRQGAWQTVRLDMDFSADLMTLVLDGTSVASWPLSWSAHRSDGAQQVAALNFYAVDEDARFWLDEFCLSRRSEVSVSDVRPLATAGSTAWRQ